MTDHPFSAYLAEQPEPQRTTLSAMAASLRAILPGAQECISYGMPAFAADGTSVAGIAGFKHHCSYFPHSGSVLEQLSADLIDYDYDFDKGTLRFAVDKPLPAPLLRKLVVTRLRLESERPARNGKVREFYDNGFLKSKGSTKDSQMHGAWAFYRKDGSVMRTGQFKLGVQVGIWRTFDRSGRLVKETTF
jgi:uncharacterized protein YdhG (YjbR/CyaY superfamily)